MLGMMRSAVLLPLAALLVAAGVAAWFFTSAAQDKSKVTDPVPLAIVAGEPIHDEALLAEIAAELHDVRRREYEIKKQALEQRIQEKLFAAEAARRGVSVEELLAAEVLATVEEVPEAEVRALYDAQRSRIGQPYYEVREIIRRLMQDARVGAARERFAEELAREYGVVILLRPPRVEVTFDPLRLRGPADAPVMLVEFSDYQCTFCRRSQPVLVRLLEKYGDRLGHAYRDFPLDDIHPAALHAAEAARCAAERGRFWEYNALLFEHFGRLDRETLLAHAGALELDRAWFAACLDSGRYTEAIRQDIEEGRRAGVQGTPAFFINGIPLFGAQPIEEFEKVIDAELALLAYRSRSR
jgi:2-hydroxychromene-2-carboxylate isomerase